MNEPGLGKDSRAPRAITYVAPTFPLASQTFVYREVRALRQRGWKVMVASLYPPTSGGEIDADLSEDRIILYGSHLASTLIATIREIFRYPIRAAKTLITAGADAIHPLEQMSFSQRIKLPAQALASLGLADKLRSTAIERIHCHFANAPTSIGMYAAMQMGVPFSFTGHANDLFHHRGLLKRKLQRAEFVACISKWHRGWYQEIVPGNGSKYQVIRCGVDIDAWRPQHMVSSPNDVLRILTICRLVEKKGVDTLIRAVSFLMAAGNRVQLSIGGDGPEQARLLRLASELGCQDSLHWLGAVDNKKVPSLMAQSDVFVLPCRNDSRGDRDGIPVALMEAMACGIPVISGDLPAIRELIDDNISGLLIPGGDANALAQRLMLLAVDPQLGHRLAQAGREKVVSEFALEPNVDRLAARFCANAAPSRPRSPQLVGGAS
ncbi:MAG: glycosyltransferase family 4 protein [Planctomycetota bacterium]|nr:glycosyltransferase family 4 protein [Planctomycetota bacterium]